MTNVCRKCKDEIYRPSCIRCESDDVSMNGQVINANSIVKQRYVCNGCRRTFRIPIDQGAGSTAPYGSPDPRRQYNPG